MILLRKCSSNTVAIKHLIPDCRVVLHTPRIGRTAVRPYLGMFFRRGFVLPTRIKLVLAIIACCMATGCANPTGGALRFSSAAPSWGPLIAVYPIENLSGAPAPLKELHEELSASLQRAGARIVDRETLDRFFERHWVRYVGGIDETTAAALWDEMGADAVLITSLELYSDQYPPRIALMARLVSTAGIPEIRWMDSYAKAGEDTPGLLGLKKIDDPVRLRGMALEYLEASLKNFIVNPPERTPKVSARETRENKPFTISDLMDKMKEEPRRLADDSVNKRQWFSLVGDLFQSRYRPKSWYSSRDVLDDQLRSLAIIPFLDLSTRKHGAEVLVLHLAKQLVVDGSYKVVELGVIRDKMLNLRIIMTSGVSNSNIDSIANSLGVELIVNGKLFDYLESNTTGQNPKVDFSLQMFERDTRKILWNSHSRNQGNDGVFFFDVGQLSTASALTDKMGQSLIKRLNANSSLK